MATSANDPEFLPRIVPTPCHIKALKGLWSLEGRSVRLYEEPGTGVLMALNDQGRQVNPLKVISRGRKLEEHEVEDEVPGVRSA